MGLTISSSLLPILSDPLVSKLQEEFLLTPRQIAKLYSIFQSGDKDNSGELNASEFHLLFSEEPSPFLTHLFESQDINHDKNLIFAEFLSLIATFCCYSEPQMVRFAFETFDKDNSGSISEAEIREFIESLDKGNSDFPKAAKRAMAMFDADGDGTIDFDEFFELNLRFPHLLWPAFRLQFRIQERTLGLNTWRGLQKKIKEKGKSEIQYGPRPLCPFCFCLPRPVLNARKVRAYSLSRKGAASKKSRKSVVSKVNPNAAAQAADVAALVSPEPNRRRSSVAVGSLPESAPIDPASPQGRKMARKSVAMSKKGGILNEAKTIEEEEEKSADFSPQNRQSQLSPNGKGTRSFSVVASGVLATAESMSTGGSSLDGRNARRRQSEFPTQSRGPAPSKLGVKPLPRRSLATLPGQVNQIALKPLASNPNS